MFMELAVCGCVHVHVLVWMRLDCWLFYIVVSKTSKREASTFPNQFFLKSIVARLVQAFL